MGWSAFSQVIHNLHIKKIVLVVYGSKINEPSPWCRKSYPRSPLSLVYFKKWFVSCRVCTLWGNASGFCSCVLPNRVLGVPRPWQGSLQLLGVCVGLYEGICPEALLDDTAERPPCWLSFWCLVLQRHVWGQHLHVYDRATGAYSWWGGSVTSVFLWCLVFPSGEGKMHQRAFIHVI